MVQFIKDDMSNKDIPPRFRGNTLAYMARCFPFTLDSGTVLIYKRPFLRTTFQLDSLFISDGPFLCVSRHVLKGSVVSIKGSLRMDALPEGNISLGDIHIPTDAELLDYETYKTV